jgi:hypothetical protein
MTESNEEKSRPRKQLIGPGLGLIILGLAYLIWWLMPFAWEAYYEDPRWAHNWAYAIIIMNVGLAWYHKSALSRTIVAIQSFMMPVTASGSFNTLIITYITIVIFIFWAIVVVIERIRGKMFLQDSLQQRAWLWINMHSLVVAWILIAHMGLVFLIGRVPLERQLLGFGTDAGFLANLPPEGHEFATWFFDITLIIWAVIALYEQFKMGYNVKNKPWPKWSFYWTFVCMGSGLLGLAINELLSIL